ncbi:MAG TPA: hypothetical protein VGF24_35755 [Vicinamibacterales bacterium]
MNSRLCIRSLLYAGFVAFVCSALATTASAQQPSPKVQSLRTLGGPTRFTPRVNTIDALKKTMSAPRIQTDIGTVLEKAGLSSTRGEVLKALTDGTVMETSLPSGTEMQWMALRRDGKQPDITGPVRWDGKMPLEGFQFVVDDLVGTYTFFVPKICGNLSLLSREPSREAARRAEEAKKAAAAAEAAKKAQEDAARRAEEAKRAAAAKADEERRAEEARKAEEAARAEAERKAEEARKAAEAKAEADRLAAEEAALRIRPFIGGYFGKQQRQYDTNDPAGLGRINPDNWVPSFGNKLVGIKGGVQFGNQGLYFAPAIGWAFNVDESDRSSGFVDGEVGYRFMRARGMQLGTGVSLWDFNHSNHDTVTLAWLGTAHFPIVGTAREPQLQFSIEWRQFFDRMSDPDVNYQFWGGVRFLFR